MSGDDDDIAANRIKHQDGSYVAGPVTASRATWLAMLALLPTNISDTQVSALRSGLTALAS
jgi:hypothetical protein